jgi:hypothetical protein
MVLTDPVKAKERLERDDCRFLGENDYDLFVASLQPIPDYKKGKEPSKEVVKWSKEHGIYGLLVSDAECYATIIRIFKQQSHKQIIEQLLMTNLDAQSVAELFEEGTGGIAIDEHIVKLYQHYFWDTRAMSRLDWHQFLFIRSGFKEIAIYPNARDLWAALYIKPQLVLCKMGYLKFQNIDKSLALNDLFNTAFLKSKEEATIGSTHNFSKAAQVAIQAFEVSESSSSDIDEIARRIQQRVKLIKNPTETIQIEAVTAGRHSASTAVVLPLKKEDK